MNNKKNEKLKRLKLFNATYSTYKIIIDRICELKEDIITINAEISIPYLKNF